MENNQDGVVNPGLHEELAELLQPLACASEGDEVLAERETRIVLPDGDVLFAVELMHEDQCQISAEVMISAPKQAVDMGRRTHVADGDRRNSDLVRDKPRGSEQRASLSIQERK